MSSQREHRGRTLGPQARLQRARRFYNAARFSAAARDASAAFTAFAARSSASEASAAAVLGLFAYARAGEFERGWQLVLESEPQASGQLDFCYAACYLAYQRGDCDETERWGRSFLAAHARAGEAQPGQTTRDQLHEILNTLGCAARDRGDNRCAAACFAQALDAAPDYALPYLNLALLQKRSGAIQEARQTVETGLARCGSSEELRLFKDGLLTERTISLCMIVKDEEEMLAEALASARPVVDEIIVVDTGSTDRTAAVALAGGARVYHHPWEDDFSKARNQSLSYATCDWILVLDADERLHPGSAPLVRRLAQTCLQEAVSFSVYNVDLDSGQTSFLPSVRLFRNRRGYVYRGIVHNQIDLPHDTPVLRAPVRVDHYGYTPSLARRRGKYERTTRLLRRQLQANPDDAFAHFNMAQIMRGSAAGKSRWRQVARHAGRVIELIPAGEPEHRHILLMGYHQLATASLHLEEFESAERACREALELKPDYLDALITLGHVLTRLGRHVDAREAFLDYLRARDCYDESRELRGFILLHLESWHEAYYGLGLVEEARGEFAAALEWYRRVLESKSRYLDTHARIGRLCYTLGRNEQAREAFEAELVSEPDSFWPHFCLGDIGMQCGRWQEAMEHYQSALQLQPQHTSLHVNIAACAFQLGRVDLAHEHLGLADPALLKEPAALRLGDALFHSLTSYPVMEQEDTAMLRHGHLLAMDPAAKPAKQSPSSLSPT